MKTLFIILWLAAGDMPGLACAGNSYPLNTGYGDSVLNTAANINYLSPLEKEIIFEINKFRADPAKYAKEHIEPLAKNYKGNMLYYPGDLPINTREGVKALNECVSELKKKAPLPLLYPCKGLALAAEDHVKDQSRTGRTGHGGSDSSNSRTRIERYGQWKVRIAENISYGGITAQQIVIYLLIDDGVRDRGHRKNFLNPDFKKVGVAMGEHPEYGIMTVMDLAGGFVER